MNWKNNRSYVAGGIVLLLLAGVLWYLLSTDSSASRTNAAGRRSIAGIWYGSRTDSAAALNNGDLSLNPVEIQRATAEEYRRRAQFPPNSEPIPSDGQNISDPIFNDARIAPDKITNPNNPGGPFLYHYLERNNYYPGETAVIRAYVIKDSGGEKIKTEALTAVLTESGGMKGKILETVQMYDNGKTGDVEGDLVYTAAFSSSLLRLRPHNYTIVVRYDVDGQELSGTNSFNYGTLGIKSTGKFIDWVGRDNEGGPNLYIRGEFKIEEAGAYHAVGSLYNRFGVPLGIAQAREVLSPGVNTIELRWWGKIICDARDNGPYTLKYMMLSNVSQMPGPRSPLMQNVHTTSSYKYDQFTCDGLNDPFFLEKAKQIDEEIRSSTP